MRRLIVLAILPLAVVAGYIGYAVWPDGGAKSQVVVDPETVSPLLQNLAPGATFHTVTVGYRRYGPAAPEILPENGPEWTRNEVWLVFDDAGAVASYRGEARTIDGGDLYGTTALDGDDLVSRDENGVEVFRLPGFKGSLTVEALRASIEAATLGAAQEVADQNPPVQNVEGVDVQVLETRRALDRTRLNQQAGVTGYSIPYIADLHPVEEVRRSYILPGEYREIKTEVVIVSEDGTETVVESHDRSVFEVIAGDGLS